jgi:hypothetical protein
MSLASIAAKADDGIMDLPLKMDYRGLFEVNGILRMNSEGNWGANNLVIKPSGGWAAQDYCLKNIKKEGSTLTADFNTNPKIKMVETVTDQKTNGKKSTKVHYTLTSTEGGTVSYEQVYLFFPFATKDFAGGKAILNDKTEIKLPKEPGDAIQIPEDTKSITLSNEKQFFSIKTDNLKISLKDLRPKTTAFQIWLEYPNPKDKKTMELDFEMSAGILPYVMNADGKDWVELPYTNQIVKNSIMDFSFLSDTPAGKYGRIINKDGHYAYEKTGKRVKMVGANLCYTANYLEKPEADKIAEHFKRMGYNTVRFHHTDVYLIKGNWNSNKSDDIDPEYLDKLDYMFAAMKKAGMYVTIDLYAQGRYDKGEIEGIDKAIEGDIKGLIPIHKPAFEAWKKMVVKWMNHVNPYTGIAWKDDPALISICPVNEDTISASAWGQIAKPFYLKRFEEWKKENNLTSKTTELKKDPIFAQFLIEVKMESNIRVEAFLRELGVKAMLTGSNWWDTMGQTFTRDQFDLVDNHQYSDHPSPWYLPAKYNQVFNLKNNTYTYVTPIMMASTRIFGKPFTVSEYNYCSPNRYRAEGGALMGAYAALQDWDALYRFAWSHDDKKVNNISAMAGFDMSTDPLNQLTERQIVLMFRRGDVAPGKNKLVYGVTMKDATSQGVGDMWSQGFFPHAFNAMALISQTGSQVAEGNRKIEGEFDAVVSDTLFTNKTTLAGNKFIATKDLPAVGKHVTSDTGEITLDSSKGYIKVQSPKTECIVAPANINLTANNISITNNSSFCSISASSMDDATLKDSQKILIFHLTNVLNSELKASSKDIKTLTDWGKLPYIVQTGCVSITLKNSNPKLKLYACDFSGRRIREIAAKYENEAYMFKAEISAENPYMIYELTK